MNDNCLICGNPLPTESGRTVCKACEEANEYLTIKTIRKKQRKEDEAPMIKFEILGQPIAKQRPRVTRAGIAYTPAKTVNYEAIVRYTYQSQYPRQEQILGRIEANITAVFPIPKSYSKKKTAELLEGHCNYDKKPDCDNLAKIVLDSLNGIAYKDDSQVTVLRVVKEYGAQPKVIVELKEI